MAADKISTVMVTGAGGFLGTELLHQISNHEEYSVIALTSNVSKIHERFPNNNKITCFALKDMDSDNIPWNDIDIIIHCAFARTYEGHSLAETLDFTANLLSRAKNEGVKGFINISSQSVYGDFSTPPWNERTKVSPNSTYAMAKYATEVITKVNCEKSGMDYTNIRLSSLVGPGLDIRLVSKFIINAIRNEPIKVIGGNQKLSFMHVKDAAEGIVALIKIGTTRWKTVYNLGSTNRNTVKEIAEIVRRIAPLYIANEVSIEIEQKDVNLDSGMDSSLLYEDTGWVPEYDMKAIVKSLFEYYMSRR